MNASRLAPQSTTTPNIQTVIDGMQANLATAIARQEQIVRRWQKQETAWRQKEECAERLTTRRFQMNLRAAVTGAQKIIAFAQTPGIQELIRLEGDLRATFKNDNTEHFIPSDEGEFIFFIGGYVSAEDDSGVNDLNAYVVLKPQALWFIASDYNSLDNDERLFEIPFADSDKVASYLTAEDGPEHFNGPLISSETRRDCPSPFEMWSGGENALFYSYSRLFGKMLIECADPKKFERYCSTAIAHLSR